MSSTNARFHGRKQAVSLIRKGRPVRSNGFSVKFGNPKNTRTIIVVSKKVDKRAVVRNKIRRRLSSAIRELRQTKNIGDVAVIVYSEELASRQYLTIKNQIDRAAS